MLLALAEQGWVQRTPFLMQALSITPPKRESDEDFLVGYDAVQRIEEFHTLAHDPALVDIMRQVVGETAWPHPLKIARLSFPGHFEAATPPHQDFPNNQGTPDLTASWVPVGDCPRDLGGLAILRGSHRYGLLPLDRHLGPGNRRAVLPVEMLEQLHWVTTDFEVGDVLLFPSMTVHASLHNISEFNMRLSVDFRWQQEGEPLTEIVLHPHFQRLSWDEIYADWKSDKWQYYWRDLDYEVVPFEDYPLLSDDRDPDWHQVLLPGERQQARFERRMARLAEGRAETPD